LNAECAETCVFLDKLSAVINSYSLLCVDCIWNVMAHAHKPDFIFRRSGWVHLNRRGRQFSQLLAAEVCALALVMLDTLCSEVVWRVLFTHSIHQFPLHIPPPCVDVSRHISTGLSILVHGHLGPERLGISKNVYLWCNMCLKDARWKSYCGQTELLRFTITYSSGMTSRTGQNCEHNEPKRRCYSSSTQSYHGYSNPRSTWFVFLDNQWYVVLIAMNHRLYIYRLETQWYTVANKNCTAISYSLHKLQQRWRDKASHAPNMCNQFSCFIIMFR